MRCLCHRFFHLVAVRALVYVLIVVVLITLLIVIIIIVSEAMRDGVQVLLVLVVVIGHVSIVLIEEIVLVLHVADLAAIFFYRSVEVYHGYSGLAVLVFGVFC
jgi:hypothetical protein